jgi:hypothetical protein
MRRRRGVVVIMAPLSMTALGSSGERWTASTIVWERMSGGCFECGREMMEVVVRVFRFRCICESWGRGRLVAGLRKIALWFELSKWVWSVEGVVQPLGVVAGCFSKRVVLARDG